MSVSGNTKRADQSKRYSLLVSQRLDSLAVSVIPEGLVAVTTITMALAVRRMMKK